MNNIQEKQRARLAVAERLTRVNAQERETESRSICRRIRAALPTEPSVICAYMPMPTEANIVPLLEELLTQGSTIALPRTEGKAFTFRIIISIDQLEKGPFGVREPIVTTEELPIEDVQFVLVPGAAFDQTGARLGRGNGGYDKWLEKLRTVNPTAKVWGIAFDAQMMNGIPLEPHDQKMDEIITPRGVIKCKIES